MRPPWDQTGVPIHFHSSTTSGSASFTSRRTLRSVSPRQSPSSLILSSILAEAGSPPPVLLFFMVLVPSDPLAHRLGVERALPVRLAPADLGSERQEFRQGRGLVQERRGF